MRRTTTTPTTTPEITTSSKETPEGLRWWAEVRISDGKRGLLYTSAYHKRIQGAILDAKRWLRSNGYEE